jgi:hypothetical protein
MAGFCRRVVVVVRTKGASTVSTGYIPAGGFQIAQERFRVKSWSNLLWAKPEPEFK